MNNLERLKIEIKTNSFDDTVLSIFLQENGLEPTAPYDAQSKPNLKAIYIAALSALETLANDPASMKEMKLDDMTLLSFSENLRKRIDQLQYKIRSFKVSENESSIFMLYL